MLEDHTKSLGERMNELDVKFAKTVVKLEKQFATDQDEQDERVNTELKYLREVYSKLETKFTQEIDGVIDTH